MIKKFKILGNNFCKRGQRKYFGQPFALYFISSEKINEDSKEVFVKRKLYSIACGLNYSFASWRPRGYVHVSHKTFSTIIDRLKLAPFKESNVGSFHNVYKFYITPKK